MEKKIKAYEKVLEEKTSGKLGPIERVKVAEYHKEMVANFQHERLIHLIIMLFFVAVSLVLIGALAWNICEMGLMFEMVAFYFLTALVVVLTAFYIKHYYFLENHIQGLYKYTKKIRLGGDDKEEK